MQKNIFSLLDITDNLFENPTLKVREITVNIFCAKTDFFALQCKYKQQRSLYKM